MLKEALASPALTTGPLIALLVFVTFMVLLLAWIFRPRAKEQYQMLSRYALNDDQGDRHEA